MASVAPAIRRHAAVALLIAVGVCATPLPGTAQPAASRVPRIGMIVEPPNEAFLPAFRQGLKELGYSEGKGSVIEYRRVGATLDRVPDHVAELVRVGVDVLVVPGTTAAGLAKRATATKPIVFVTVGDPVGSGIVQSLARPEGNATEALGLTVPASLVTRADDIIR